MSQEYGNQSGFQKQSSLSILERLSTTLKEAAKKNPERFNSSEDPFTIVDLGCADGKNSLRTLETTISVLREINPKLPIKIYLNDTPDCDLSAAMRTVSKRFDELPMIWVYSIGKSFYKSLMPENSVDLMVSTTAIQWIPKVVCELPSFLCLLTDETLKSTEGKMWEKAAADFWETFLKERENELKVGGLLFILCPALAEAITPDELLVYEALSISKACLKKSISNNSLEYFEEYCPAVVLRSLAQFQKPFKEKKTNLQWFNHFYLRTPFFQADQDPRVCSKRFTSWIKGFFDDVFRGALKNREVNDVLVEKVIKDLEEMMVEEFTKLDFAKNQILGTSLFFILCKE